MKRGSIFFGCLIIILISGCSLTRMRYTNGFKSNFEINLRKDKGEPEKRNIAEKAKKHQLAPSFIPPNDSIKVEVERPSMIESLATQVKDSSITNFRFLNKSSNSKSNPFIKKQTEKSNNKNEIEPNIKIANILFLIYLITCFIAIIIIIGLLIGAFTIDPFLGWILIYAGALIATISLILSFILAIIGLINMQRSPGKYSGAFSAWLIITFVLLPFLSTLYTIIFQ